MTRLGSFIAFMLLVTASEVLVYPAHAEESKFGTPKGDEGTRIFKATEHPHYSGEFRLKGDRAFLVGSMSDTAPWDHLDYAGKRLNSVKGTIDIEVNELTNTAAGAPRPCIKVTRCSTRTMTRTSWSWSVLATPRPMRFDTP